MPDNMTGADFQNAFVSDAPDFGDIYEKATAQALQHISPHAASIVNGGGPGALQQPQDITSQLNRSLPQFQLQGAPVMAGGGEEEEVVVLSRQVQRRQGRTTTQMTSSGTSRPTPRASLVAWSVRAGSSSTRRASPKVRLLA